MNQNDIVYYVSPKLEIRNSEVHGLGVFAKEKIISGETIEICRMLQLAWRMKYHSDSVLRDYSWINNCTCKECTTHGSYMYIALGYGSLYNHSDNPNTDMKINYNDKMGTVVALMEIEQGQEVFVSYGRNYWKSRNKS